MIELYKNQISYGQEIVEVSKVFFTKTTINDEAKVFMDENNGWAVYESFKNFLGEDYSIDNIKAAIEKTKDELNVKGKNLFMPIRIGVSNQMHGPELVPTLKLILENI